MDVSAYLAVLVLLTMSEAARTESADITTHKGFTIKPSDKVINLNTSVSFPCRAVGNPVIFWEKAGRDQLLTSGERFRLSPAASVDEHGTLHIRHALYDAVGRYNCIAVYPSYAIHTSLNLKVIDFRVPAAPPTNISVLRIPGEYIVVTWSPPPMKYGRVNITEYSVYLRGNGMRYNRRLETQKVLMTSGELVATLDYDATWNYSIMVAAKSPFGVGPRSRLIKPRKIHLRTNIFETAGWNKTGPKVTIIEQSDTLVKVNVTWPPIPHFYHLKRTSYFLQMKGSDGTFDQKWTSSESAIMPNLRRGRTYTFRVRPKNERQVTGPWTPKTEFIIPSIKSFANK